MRIIVFCFIGAVVISIIAVSAACLGNGDKSTATATASAPAGTGSGAAAPAAESTGEETAKETPKPDKDGYAADEAFEKMQKIWEGKLSDDFRYKVVKPFLVVSNQSRRDFESDCNRTVKSYTEAYYKTYLTKKPDYVLTIFLFKNGKTYRSWAKKLFDDDDVAYYGYFSPSERALVMNIGTGGGTLVHEMFHALVEPEFPDIPAWVNEGIASLYEACWIAPDGHIKGAMNWRFPNLKKNLNTDKYVKLRDLMETTTAEFYSDPNGLHYAEARYFCMWLEKKDLLIKFYKKFLKDHKEDPTGIKTIESVMGKKVEEFEKEWRKWAGKQRYSR